MSRLGQTRLSGPARLAQLRACCTERPQTLTELAIAMRCSEQLVRYYLQRAPQMQATTRAGSRCLEYRWVAEDT